MGGVRLLVLLVAVLVTSALVFAGGAGATDVRVATLPATADMSMPFWCDWGYDWDERCYRDDSDRLGVGGVGDKVWRAAVRFGLDALPPGAAVVTAELSLWYDGTCVAPRRRSRPCDGRGFELDAHPIFTPRWLAEREVEFGPVLAVSQLEPFANAGWIAWDVTDLVSDWHSGGLPNDRLLLKLADGEEELDSGGPYFPSSSYADQAVRPRLTVWYEPG
jgi:hypothetical protein